MASSSGKHFFPFQVENCHKFGVGRLGAWCNIARIALFLLAIQNSPLYNFFIIFINISVTYCLLALCFSSGGDTSSQDGGENITSRQHDWSWGHGPPGAPY